MRETNNFYLVAKELYQNESLTVAERAGQIAGAFAAMIESGVVTMADFEEFLQGFENDNNFLK